jgi:hypothetical protein
MAKEAQPEKLDDAEPLALFALPGLVPLVVCDECHHHSELRPDYIRRRVGLEMTVGQLRRRLRCKKCGTRQPIVLAYRMPR